LQQQRLCLWRLRQLRFVRQRLHLQLAARALLPHGAGRSGARSRHQRPRQPALTR
jgi:hypothetical protein